MRSRLCGSIRLTLSEVAILTPAVRSTVICSFAVLALPTEHRLQPLTLAVFLIPPPAPLVTTGHHYYHHHHRGVGKLIATAFSGLQPVVRQFALSAGALLAQPRTLLRSATASTTNSLEAARVWGVVKLVSATYYGGGSIECHYYGVRSTYYCYSQSAYPGFANWPRRSLCVSSVTYHFT